MFGSNPKTSSATPVSKETDQSAYGSAPNRISSGVSITGDVKFSSELVIDGEVEGNITSSGKLTIGTHATVIGDIRAGFVTIQGAVEGNVLAAERCAHELVVFAQTGWPAAPVLTWGGIGSIPDLVSKFDHHRRLRKNVECPRPATPVPPSLRNGLPAAFRSTVEH